VPPSKPQAESHQGRHAQKIAPKSATFKRILDQVASWQVPHRYFLHFYIASVVSTLFWAGELLRRGPVFVAISSQVDPGKDTPSMSFNQLTLCWALMAIQGTRRLWESIALAKPSRSKMWFVHWILGVAFYIAMGMSIWVEGIRTNFIGILKESKKLIQVYYQQL
jgi:3-oxo-5-alpha-steroid 4-dehydrogenase 3